MGEWRQRVRGYPELVTGISAGSVRQEWQDLIPAVQLALADNPEKTVALAKQHIDMLLSTRDGVPRNPTGNMSLYSGSLNPWNIHSFHFNYLKIYLVPNNL